MISNALAATLGRRDVHYGWVVVASTFLTMLVTAAAMGAPGVLIVPLEKEFGWSTSEISAALALRILLYGLLGPFAAAFMNRFGVRRVVLTALALLCAGFVASLGMTGLWQLMMLWGVVVGVGSGFFAMVLAATVATRWINKSRGSVVGLLAASSATGQLVFLPVVAQLTTVYGWRTALAFMCAMLAATALVTLALMRDRPADLALPIYGEAAVTPTPAGGHGLWSLLASPLVV